MKKIFLFVSIAIILLAIPFTVYFVGKNQEIRKRAAPASTLSFTPPSQSIRAGQNFTLSVKLDTATNQVGLIQLRIVYDPVYLQAVDITNDTFAPSIRVSKKIDPNGKVSISVGAKDSTHPITGSGNIAILTMKALKGSATPILVKFTPSPDTTANALGEGQADVLVGRSPASITILNADGSQSSALVNAAATPTATPTHATTVTPTHTPALTPTLAPTLEATDSAEASGSAVEITSIEENETVTTTQPVIAGIGNPGTTVTLIIHSETGTTVTVTVDENGNWTYTPTTPLAPGEHTVEALVTDANTGEQQSVTTSFIVASGNEVAAESSGSAVPVTGYAETTLLFVVIGVVIFLSGAIIPFFIQ